MVKVSNEDKRYDYIVVGAGAAGSVLAAELSASGAQVLVIESGGPDDAPTNRRSSPHVARLFLAEDGERPCSDRRACAASLLEGNDRLIHG
jgi:choline dehydrogenase-like flavoprotein